MNESVSTRPSLGSLFQAARMTLSKLFPGWPTAPLVTVCPTCSKCKVVAGKSTATSAHDIGIH